MKKQLLLSFLLGVLSLSLLQVKAQVISPGEGGILFVKKGGSGNQSGDSWANAISELDDALEWVHTGWDGADPLQVWVAAGTYTPEANGFVMKNDVALYGGFDGTETSLGQRNWATNQTVLSGLLPDTSPSKRIIANVFSFINPLTNSAVLDGFILQNGYDEQNGGGIYNQWASPTLSNLIIRGNVAGWNGGGIFNTDFSSPRLTNVTISGNRAEFAMGGGIYNENSDPVLTNVTISGNWADWEGGGIANMDSSPMLVNTIVWGNFPEDINFNSGSAPDIRYSLIGNGDCPLLAVCTDMASGEPGFTNAPDADAAPFIAGLYTLEEGSAAINAGDPATSLALFPGGPDDPLDLAGRPRVFSGDGAVIDIGAYEYSGESPDPPTLSPNALNFVEPSYVGIPDADLLDLTGSYTLECWIKPDHFNHQGGLISKYHSPGANGYLLRLSGTDPYTGLDFDGMSTANGILQPGVWHHIAAVNQAGTRRLYVNGKEHALTGTPVEVVANNNLLTLGMDYAPDPGFFNGSIDEVRIWNTARTQEQIRTSMNAPVDPGSAGLVAYYQFDVGIPGANNSSLTDVADVTGNGNDGLAIGFAMIGNTSNWVESYAMVVPVLHEAEDIFGISFKAVWSAPERGTADYYRLDIAMDPDFNSIVDGYNGRDVGNVTEYAVSGLPVPGTYYYRVRAVSSSSGTGAPSNVVSVVVGTDYAPDENGILYVRKGANGNQSGSSWTNAISELADALKWVHDGWDGVGSLQVWVAGGSYFPTPFASPLDNGFRLRNNVAIYGGFAGGSTGSPAETSLDQRDWIANPTILTGSGERRVVTNVFTSGAPLTATAILDGFILENGFDIFHGGAIYNQWASPTLSNLLIRDNAANENGGGIYNTNSAPVLSHVTVRDNAAGGSGGGVYDTGSSNPVLTRVTISSNTALFSGGASITETAVSLSWSMPSSTGTPAASAEGSSLPTLKPS